MTMQQEKPTVPDIELELATGAGFKRVGLWFTALGLFLVGIPSVFIGAHFALDIAMHPETHFDGYLLPFSVFMVVFGLSSTFIASRIMRKVNK